MLDTFIAKHGSLALRANFAWYKHFKVSNCTLRYFYSIHYVQDNQQKR